MVKHQIKIFISVFILPIIFFAKCGKDKGCSKNSHNKIIIVNNSKFNINWRLFDQDSVYKLNGQSYDNIINANQRDNYSIRHEECWESSFNNSISAYFLIFHNDTVQSIGWQSISGTDRGLLKRIKVDLNYLQQNNFTITYP